MKNKIRRDKKIHKFSFSFLKRRNIVWIGVFVFLALYVFLAVQTSSVGVRISLYEEEIQNLEKQNQEPSTKLSGSTSLTKLSQFSDEMGFKKIDDTLYIQTGESFAKAK